MRCYNNSKQSLNSHSDGKNSNQNQHHQQPRQAKGFIGLFPRSRSVDYAAHLPSGDRSMVSSAYEARRHPNAAAEAAGDFVPNPKVPTPPASPSSTPPKKVWEHHMKNFLTRRKPSSESPRSGRNTPPTPDSSATASPTNNTGVNSTNTNVKKPFSLMPGTRRLLVRNSPQHAPRATSSVNDLDVVKPRSSSPSSLSNLSALLNPTVRNDGTRSSCSSVQQQEERSVHGGNHFRSVFGRSSSDGMFQHQVAATDSFSNLPTQTAIQGRTTSSGSMRGSRHKAMDELDDTLRKGVEKSYSPDSPLYNPMIRKTYQLAQTANGHLAPSIPQPQPQHAQQLSLATQQHTIAGSSGDGGDEDDGVHHKPLNEREESESLDALLASATIRTASGSQIFSSSVSSSGSHPMVTQPHSSMTPSSSWGHYTFHHYQMPHDESFNGVATDNNGVQSSQPPTSAHAASTAAGSQLGQLMASYPYRDQHGLMAHSSVNETNGFEQVVEQAHTQHSSLHSMMQTASTIPKSLPPDGTNAADPELKKAFTAFHNGAQFAQDSTSPFLGEDPPSSTFYLGHETGSYMTSYEHQFQNYYQHHPSAALMQMMMMQGGGAYGGGSSVPQHGVYTFQKIAIFLALEFSP